MKKSDPPKQDSLVSYEFIACEPHTKGIVLSVRAHAGAKRQGMTGVREEALCISVTIAPEQGKANKAIGKVLAKFLGIATSRVELFSGATNRQKRFFVEGLSVKEVQAILCDRLG